MVRKEQGNVADDSQLSSGQVKRSAKAEKELQDLQDEYDQGVEEKIKRLVSQTPRVHRSGLISELQKINNAFARIGLECSQREILLEEVWESAWINWTGRPYRLYEGEKKGVYRVIDIPISDAASVYDFKPDAACLLSLARLLGVAHDNVIKNDSFRSCAIKLSHHLTRLATDISELERPRHTRVRKATKEVPLKGESKDNLREVPEVKAVREASLRAVQEAALRVFPIAREVLFSVFNYSREELLSAGDTVLYDFIEVGLCRDPLLQSGEKVTEEVECPWFWARDIDEEIKRREERRDVQSLNSVLRSRSEKKTEYALRKADKDRAKIWKEWCNFLYFFGIALSKSEDERTARKIAKKEYSSYLASKGMPISDIRKLMIRDDLRHRLNVKELKRFSAELAIYHPD